MVHVPRKGGAPAVQDLLAGQVDIFMSPYGKGQVQLVEEGKLKAPAVLSVGRQQLFSKVPMLDESGALKGFVFDIRVGYFVHRNTPGAIVNVLHKALGEVANGATVRGQLGAAWCTTLAMTSTTRSSSRRRDSGRPWSGVILRHARLRPSR